MEESSGLGGGGGSARKSEELRGEAHREVEVRRAGHDKHFGRDGAQGFGEGGVGGAAVGGGVGEGSVWGAGLRIEGMRGRSVGRGSEKSERGEKVRCRPSARC